METSKLITYILFIPGFFVLIKGASLLVDGASSLARKFRISDLVIGLTIVSMGTSSPELAVNILSSIRGQDDIAISNVLGSNIANILLILGISAIIKELTVRESTVWKEIPFSLLGSLVVMVMANDVFFDSTQRNQLSHNDGIIILFFFTIFLYYIFSIAKKGEIFEEEVPKKELSLWMSIIYVVVGLVMLVLGGDWVVNGAVEIAKFVGLSEAFIGLTIVAVGTSLPELAATGVAAYKGNSDIAVGNVVGSNIFNVFFILGVSATLSPLRFTEENNIDVLVSVLSSLILFFLLFLGKRHTIQRIQGIVLLSFYIAYIGFRAYIGIR
ncbi:MAG: calcium/sodium antiporter [Leptospiraceae bacterium]|nr:calcium/sodium antiporter [Leptospiraceae bacterium]MDW7976668.1 calcium/sodium antiporter [Leptospiraceae bacterium]